MLTPRRYPVHAATVVLSALLLFLVQPVIAKLILPWYGGSAGVWTTCMLFFQAVLLAGYLYAHWSVKCLGPRTQGRLHAGLLMASLAVLPVIPGEHWKPAGAGNPSLLILGALAAGVGLPYFLLSTTSPLVQAWYARERDGAAPYRLFALSNLGSLVSLVAYPFLIEPHSTTRGQAQVWSAVYAVFAVLCATLALRTARAAVRAGRSAVRPGASTPSGFRQPLLWVALAACPSALFLAITNHLTQNVASVPFLWILPLSIYLLTFILCFEGRNWYNRGYMLPAVAVALAGLAYYASAQRANVPMRLALPIFAGGLFLVAMACHGELAFQKPDARRLTLFYVCVSLGGALGGLFVGVVAPACFSGAFELPVTLVAAAAILPLSLRMDSSVRLPPFAWGLITLAPVLLAVYQAAEVQAFDGAYRLSVRNFYGVLRTGDVGDPEESDYARKLMHGTINHGQQYLHPARSRESNTYFGPNSGLGRALTALGARGPLRVGILGLGAGVATSYARSGDYYRIYEINPLVLQLARTEFTFLKLCPAKLDVVLGDGRLSLEREPAQHFDLLSMDAFSSDSVPVHLLTREAFAVYFRHLQPNGVLVLNISNRFLELGPVVRAAAARFGRAAIVVEDEDDSARGFWGTSMAIVTADRKLLASPAFEGVKDEPGNWRGFRIWTDDYSNLFGVLK